MGVKWANLVTNDDWQGLRNALDSRFQNEAVRNVLQHARDIGAVSTLIEDDYLDQDFSAEFSAFYSKVFKRYSKLCKRFHFFGVAIEPVITNPSAHQVADGLTQISAAEQYLGYIVARPVEHAPLGRVVLRAPPSPEGMKSDLLVRSEFTSHLLGASLKVIGTPFTQQDSRIAACAQASIWMAGRHLNSKHRGAPWVSTVEITEAATQPTDHVLSQSLPAGSGGLTVDNMVRALRAMGREPLMYFAKPDPRTRQFAWPPTIRPSSIVERYIDSGIPAIVGLRPWQAGQEEWHAVVATGHTLRNIGQDPLPQDPTRSEFCRFLLVSDDQRGSSLRLPLSPGDPLGQTPYDATHIAYIILPLPSKVYTPAESAEKLAWDLIRHYSADWPALRQRYAQQLAVSAESGDAFVASVAANQVIARTYLTYGWRYKQRMIQNTCSDVIKNSILQHDFPRYVWVTEFGTRASFNNLDEREVRIFAHAVIDATSSRFWEGRCIFHAPGFIWRWYHDPGSTSGYIQSMAPIGNERPYGMKIRGSHPN